MDEMQTELSDIAVEQVQNVDELAALKDEVASLKSQLAYSLADFENYKKRSYREKAELMSNANENIANDIFPIIDNFEIAAETMKRADFNGNHVVLSGIQMVMSQLVDALKKHGFEKVEVEAGSVFDVNVCEAVSAEESSQEVDTVIRVLSSGWIHNGKLIRPAKVVVAR